MNRVYVFYYYGPCMREFNSDTAARAYFSKVSQEAAPNTIATVVLYCDGLLENVWNAP